MQWQAEPLPCPPRPCQFEPCSHHQSPPLSVSPDDSLSLYRFSVTQSVLKSLSITQNVKKIFLFAKKNALSWKNYAIANKKLCQHHFKTYIIIYFSTFRFQEKYLVPKNGIVANNCESWNRHQKFCVGTYPNWKPKKRKISWNQIWNQTKRIWRFVIKCVMAVFLQ